jgi:hypothetical protein
LLANRRSVRGGLSVAERNFVAAWEYMTTPLIVHNTSAILNNWGSQGWELVQIVQGPEGGLVAYLKRPAADA